MNINTLNKIFPAENCELFSDLKINGEGLWSITHPDEADQISFQIIKILGNNKSIIDMNAGCGGNVISFCKNFNKVTGVEINKDTFTLLKNNVECYNYNNITLLNDDCMNHIKNNYDIYFFDPPWGGPNYKNQDKIQIKINGVNLEDVIDQIDKSKLKVLKLPYNYNNNFKNIIKEIKIGNIIILFIK